MKVQGSLLTMALMVAVAVAGVPSYGEAPLVRAYAGRDSVGNVTVSITNLDRDAGILVTSVEFKGQLPEVRYFYHGIYGSIEKAGDNYVYSPLSQVLSMSVGSCFLLPGQSATWERPLRVLDTGYDVEIAWCEIPADKIASSVWFESRAGDGFATVYEPLSRERETIYSNMTAARTTTPNVVVEGDFQAHTATVHTDCASKRLEYARTTESPEGFPKGSIEFSLEPIAENVVVTDREVIFRTFNMNARRYEPIETPPLTPIVADFLALCVRSADKTIPCILAKKDFGDLLDVQEPYTEMYYNPGITPVPLKLFPKVLDRATELHLTIDLKRIDPNSLAMQLVLTVGVQIDHQGKEISPTASPRGGGQSP